MMTTDILVQQTRAPAGQRKVLRCRTELRLSSASPIVVRAVDIWHGGMTLVSDQTLEQDTYCTAIFYIPAPGVLQIVSATAKVFYCTAQNAGGARIGLRFQQPDRMRSGLIDRLG